MGELNLELGSFMDDLKDKIEQAHLKSKKCSQEDGREFFQEKWTRLVLPTAPLPGGVPWWNPGVLLWGVPWSQGGEASAGSWSGPRSLQVPMPLTRERACYTCGAVGHIVWDCPGRFKGNSK